MPRLDISVELYAAVASSVFDHFQRGTLVAALPRYDGPFLLVHGDSDPLPVEASRVTAELVPHAVLETMENCGHFPWLERPDRLASIVHAFLA
jgi:proline iminopeptidase